MSNKKFIFYNLFFIIILTNTFSDFIIITDSESSLPYELNSTNYQNSPNNYSNNINNYINSSSNYSNSSSNYQNSPNNFKNSKNGSNRLLIEDEGTYKYVGYYSINNNNVVNFYTEDGERIFYSPPETYAIFDSNSGKYCGVIARLNKQNVLVVTENGQDILTENRIFMYNKKRIYPNTGMKHWVKEKKEMGSIIILEDNSVWEIFFMDKIKTGLWLPTNTVIVVQDLSNPQYDYLIINKSKNETARAKYIGVR